MIILVESARYVEWVDVAVGPRLVVMQALTVNIRTLPAYGAGNTSRLSALIIDSSHIAGGTNYSTTYLGGHHPEIPLQQPITESARQLALALVESIPPQALELGHS